MATDSELPAPGERLYNLDQVKEISRGNDAFVKRMVHIFTERIPTIIDNINEAYNSGNFKKVYDLAHLLKPSIDNMGVITIKGTIRSIEELALQDPASPLLYTNIGRLETILMMVFEQLKDEMN